MSLYVFQQNEKEFQKKMDEFHKYFQSYALSQKQAIIKEQLKLAIVQCEQQLKFMDIEANACNPSTKQEIAPKLRQYKVAFSEAQKKLKEIELGLQDSSRATPPTNTYGSRLVQINTKIEGQTQDLQHLELKLNETEQTSTNIIENMKNQKEKLLRALDDTNQIRTDLSRTNRQVGMMKNRETYNKGILISLICILSIGNILIIYYKFS